MTITIDGSRPLSPDVIADISAVCDAIEDNGDGCAMVVDASGAPQGPWSRDLSLALVSRWERGLRRLERLPALTIAIGTGDCGGPALDALLVADYRIAGTSLRLTVPVLGDATWPGMTLFRLARQARGAAVRRAALLGIPILAAQALELGLVDEVTSDTDGAVSVQIQVAGALSGAELAIRRQLIADATTVGFEDALGAHLAACDRLLRRSSAGG